MSQFADASASGTDADCPSVDHWPGCGDPRMAVWEFAASLTPMAIAIDDPRASGGTEWSARLDGYVERARIAADALRRLDQEAVYRIVWTMTVAGLEHAVELAELAMEETKFG